MVLHGVGDLLSGRRPADEFGGREQERAAGDRSVTVGEQNRADSRHRSHEHREPRDS